MNDVSRTGMTRARWKYLKALHPSRGNFVHISAEIIPNPTAAIAEAAGKPFFGPKFVVGARRTYNVGRNKAKRERRAKRFGT